MRLPRFLALMVIAIGTCASAQTAKVEPTPAPAVSQFLMGTRLGYITCSEKYRSYLEKFELYALVTEGQKDPRGTPPSDSEVADCVHQTALRGGALYKEAVKGANSPKAKTAYSDYMAAWDAALRGIRRSERETVEQYRARQRKVEERLNALQSKLEESVPAGSS